MKRLLVALTTFALALAGFERAQAGVIVVPNAQTSVEGNSNNSFPFNIALGGLSSMRYQQVYGASDFSAAGGPVLITQIAFRPDATFGSAFSSTLPSVQIDLSTTSKGPDGLSSTFANNVGANDKIVFSGPLSLSSAFTGPAGGPKDFDIVINLQNPFVFDPTTGNLLLDVRNFGGGSTTVFDAQFTFGDASSRVLSTDVGSTSGLTDTEALVTRFTFQPVPEPPAYLLWGLALGCAVPVVMPLVSKQFSSPRAGNML